MLGELSQLSCVHDYDNEVPPKKWRLEKDKVHLDRRQSDEPAQGETAIQA